MESKEEKMQKNREKEFAKYLKRIDRQYGKNIKKFEEVTLNADVSDEIMEMYAKHKIDINSRKPMVSILLTRWGFEGRGSNNRKENTINSYEDIEKIISENK